MNQITPRGMPDGVREEIERIARKRDTSINRTINDLLQEALGVTSSSKRKRDLSGFVRTWSAEEAAEFDEAGEVFEAIDKEVRKY